MTKTKTPTDLRLSSAPKRSDANPELVDPMTYFNTKTRKRHTAITYCEAIRRFQPGEEFTGVSLLQMARTVQGGTILTLDSKNAQHFLMKLSLLDVPAVRVVKLGAHGNPTVFVRCAWPPKPAAAKPTAPTSMQAAPQTNIEIGLHLLNKRLDDLVSRFETMDLKLSHMASDIDDIRRHTTAIVNDLGVLP